MISRVYVGSKLPVAVDQQGAPQLSWPDKDLRMAGGVRVEGSGAIVKIGSRLPRGVHAVALGYDTDWDLVRIQPSGGGDPIPLGPGELVRLPGDSEGFEVLPIVNVPSTRLYDASTLQRFGAQTPTSKPQWQLNDDVITNTGSGNQDIQKWNGTQWVFSETVASGANAVNFSLSAHSGADAGIRPADLSPDGLWSFADYIEASLIIDISGAARPNNAYISFSATDSRGNPGSNGAATTIKYKVGSNVFADISTLFYGRLALDLFDDCPPHGYVPRLAPSRFVTLGALAVPHIGGVADSPILTVPALNVERAQFTFKNSGAQDAYAQLLQPRAEDWIDGVAGVADDAGATIGTGAAGAVFLDEPASAFIKVAMGAAAGGTTIAAGAVLELVRRVVP